MHSVAPNLQTDRLLLRAYRIEDFEGFAEFYGSERSQYADGPVSRAGAWHWFAAGAGRWALVGYGAWAIERAEDGAYIGIISLNHPIADKQERELGWLLWEGYEGQGYASEAAKAARDFAVGTLNWDSFVSYISRDNHSSIRLAERLDAQFDPQATAIADAETLVYRHLPLLR